MHEKIESMELKGDEIIIVSVRNLKDQRRMLMLLPQLQAVQKKYPNVRFVLHDNHTQIRFGTKEDFEGKGNGDVPPNSP